MELMKGNKIHGFIIERVREISDCQGTLYEMVHEKTGAKLCWMKRAEENKTFSITFKTIPENDTGVFHILEHSVLNGSEKYPVREPFVELLKSSMQTFLNAFTYPDKTMYPVSSRNPKDFMNLMSVYMDAVFHPLIYTNPNIFYQEGWHYEIRDEEAEPVYKGVVLNEMKGAFSSVDEIIIDELNRMMFPDNCYRFVSGGDPEYITDLSYEKFIETHRKFYHPSNARVFLDGDIDIDAALAFINDEYFSHYEKEEMSFVIPMQERKPGELHRCLYEIAPDEDAKEKTQIAFASVVSDFTQAQKNLAWAVLSSVLAANNDSVLVKPILEKGLGQNVDVELYDGIQQAWAVFAVRNTEEENLEKIRETVRETVKGVVENGLNHEEIIATLNQMEFQYWEKHEPSGLINAQRAMDSWLYDGDPALYLTSGKLFEELRNKAEEGYFENLLAEFLLDEEHLQTVIAVPSAKLGEEKAEKEAEKLRKAKASWGSEIKDYIEKNRILDEWQAGTDTEETLDTLPKLSLEDIAEEPSDYPWKEERILGVPVLVYPKENKSITYMNLYFNPAGIKKDKLPAFGLFSGLFGDLATEKYTVQQLQAAVKKDLGSVGFSLEAFSPDNDPEKCIPSLTVTCSVLTKNADKAVELIEEILLHSKYEKDKILQLLKQDNESYRQSLIMSGHAAALRRAASHCSAEAAFREYVGGYESGMFGKDLENNFDEMADAFIEDCEMFREVLFSRDRLTVSVTEGDLETVEKMIGSLHQINAERASVHYPLPADASEKITIPAGIAFSAASVNFKKYGFEHTPYMAVLGHMLTYDYLWSEVRVKGGAYGTGISINPNGTIAAYSFRDPNPAGSLEVFASVPEYIAEVIRENPDLRQYIIGSLAASEPLLTPSGKIRLSDSRYFRNNTHEMRCTARKKVLSMTADDLKDCVEMMKLIGEKASVCVIGSDEKIGPVLAEELTPLKQL